MTAAAGRLQADEMIEGHRGYITLKDRPRLEKRVCECYSIVRKEYDRLLTPKPQPSFGYREPAFANAPLRLAVSR